MHWPEPDEDIEEGWETMNRLRDEGKVRWIGVSNYSVSQMKRVAPLGAITSLQPPFSLVSPEVDREILPHALANSIGVIVYSPMKAGLLSGAMTRERALNLPPDDWRRRNPQFQPPRLARNLRFTVTTEGMRIDVVDDADFVVFAAAYNLLLCSDPAMASGCPADLNKDGVVDDADFVLFAAAYNELLCP